MSEQDGTASIQEIRGWYLYDWANSPFFQVVDVLMKLLLKRMAEFAVEDGTYPSNIVSAGSYPAVVLWCTAAIQVVALLSFSAFGDYGGRRKQLLMGLTFAGSSCLILIVFCFSSTLWWLTGLLRVVAGVCFMMANVYYNAFLPLLAAAHPSVTAAYKGGEANQESSEDERMQLEVAIQDEMSSKGFLTGYLGGLLAQVLSFCLLLFVQCDPEAIECRSDEFKRLFWLALCCAAVGIWWGGFALYTFKHLKPRPGPPFPQGVNVLCLGWTQACDTLVYIVRFRNTLLFVIAYFFWSDALATTQNVAVLVLADASSSGSDGHRTDSSIVLNVALATIGGAVGISILMTIQQRCSLSNKTMLLWQLSIYAVVCVASGAGMVTAFDGFGFYLVFAPVALMMGSLQANQRSLYSSLSPLGKEAAMFAFYAITDKGSALVGAAVIACVHTQTGSYQGVFWYCALAFVGSAVILAFVDVKEGIAAASVKSDVDTSTTSGTASEAD